MESLTGDLTARVDGLDKNMDTIGAILHDAAAVSAQMPELMQEVQKTVSTINRAARGVDRVVQAGTRTGIFRP